MKECPVCKNSEVEVRNNHYFCPSCSIYLGTVKEGSSLKQELKNTQSLIQAEQEALLNEVSTRHLTWGGIIQRGILLVAVLAALGFSAFFLLNRLSYVDLVNMCIIRTSTDPMRGGNQETIIKAIELIKNADRASYDDLCKNVSTISENYCLATDTQNLKDDIKAALAQTGCYIRGSKVIHIPPDRNTNDQAILTRAETIRKYTAMSKEFWQTH